MSASRLNPNVWNGEERSGGYLAKNAKPTSANSPDLKGRVYLVGVGWYWASAWIKNTRNGELWALPLQEMTDEQATKFCKPKPNRSHSAGHNSHHESPNGGVVGRTDDIPF